MLHIISKNIPALACAFVIGSLLRWLSLSHACMCTSVHACMRACVRACVRARLHVRSLSTAARVLIGHSVVVALTVRMHMCLRAHTCPPACRHARPHACTHARTHARMLACRPAEASGFWAGRAGGADAATHVKQECKADVAPPLTRLRLSD